MVDEPKPVCVVSTHATHTTPRQRNAAAAVVVAGILAACFASHPDPAMGALDRVFFFSFVTFATGLAEIFVLFLVMAILGKVDLARAFQDKHNLTTEGGRTRRLR